MSLHGFEMELSEKDAEIERLGKLYRAALEELVKQGQLITELAAAYSATRGDGDVAKKLELLKRAREATKDE